MMKKPWLMLIAVLVCSAGASWANAPGFLAVKALDGVEISIGSEAKGVTYNGQLVLMLDPGTYTVTAKKEGYGSSTHEVLVKSGEATALAIEMRESRVQTESLGAQESMVLGQKTGTIEVRSVPFSGASITINGTTYGNTDLRLRSFPVGPVRISAEYGGKTIQGVFQLKENETMMLQANFALAPSQIIEVFDVRLSIDSSDPAKRTLASVLPEGYYLELAGEYGSGTIKDIATPVRVMGPVHTIRYTDGVDYMDFEQRVDLKRGTDVRLQIPDLVLKALRIVPFNKDLGVGNTYACEIVATPDYLKSLPLSWSSSDERVMTVSARGLVTVLAAGTAVITAQDAKSGLSASVSVRSKVYAPQNIESGVTKLEMHIGETNAPAVRLLPQEAAQQLVWSVADRSVAGISAEGVVTALKEGETVVRVASAQDSKLSLEIPVRVSKIPVTGLVTGKTLFAIPGATGTIPVQVVPEQATDKSVVWSSSDPSVITVEQSGSYRVHRQGSAVVSVSTPDGLVRADMQVKGSSISLTHVEGGTFQMGSTGGGSDEKPVHSVTVGSFYMGTYEVTQDIYEQVMGSNPSYFEGARLPVENVTWHDAVAFANALSRRDGLQEVYTISGSTVSCDWSKKGYRLPTEAEWEYAARGGSKSQGYTNAAGSNTVGDVAWYCGNSGSKTQVAGTKKANELGLYDMSGNVWEWCWDWYGDYSASAQTNPRGPSSGSSRVLRGGSWSIYATLVRPAYRYNKSTPSYRYDYIGFRLVLPAD